MKLKCHFLFQAKQSQVQLRTLPAAHTPKIETLDKLENQFLRIVAGQKSKKN